MKAILSLFAAAAVLGFAAPSTAKADYPGETRIVGYAPNGAPIIAIYQPATIDAYGRPIYQWITPGMQSGYTPQRPVYGQPNFNFGVSIGSGYRPGCNPGYRPSYGYGHHHRGFHR